MVWETDSPPKNGQPSWLLRGQARDGGALGPGQAALVSARAGGIALVPACRGRGRRAGSAQGGQWVLDMGRGSTPCATPSSYPSAPRLPHAPFAPCPLLFPQCPHPPFYPPDIAPVPTPSFYPQPFLLLQVPPLLLLPAPALDSPLPEPRGPGCHGARKWAGRRDFRFRWRRL